jgi:hypothetical protein
MAALRASAASEDMKAILFMSHAVFLAKRETRGTNLADRDARESARSQFVAEGVGFEPTVRFPARRFSRP